ncbi:MAG: hypothetical protein JW969_15190 [Spirochaetales bacterium]|nr:hypothetical protein [Spirochaetales bacterium]
MKIFKHIGKLLRDFWGFAWQNKAWWMIPIAIMLLLLTLFIVVGSTIAPYIYTLF